MGMTTSHQCDCQEIFSTAEELENHRSNKNLFVCPICCQQFYMQSHLEQHARDTRHNISGDAAKRRQTFVSNLFQQINMKPADKKASMEIVRDIMMTLMKHVRSQPGGKMYSADLRRAGSHAAKLKIGKADEFDWNVDLMIKTQPPRTQGSIYYRYEDKLQSQADEDSGRPSPKNMNVDRKLIDTRAQRIPHGYASIKPVAGQVPDNCLYKGDFIPHKLLKDLYDKLKIALKDLDIPGINLSPISHGPAITLTIKPPGGGHHISVDVTATLPCNMDVTAQGWPRAGTRQILSYDKIAKVKGAGMHLVPKGDEVWCVSYSKCEKALLDGIDSGNECRKKCHKLMKRYVQIFSSKMSASGISSYIFKHQLFWMNEDPVKDPDYWKDSNFINCLLDMMKDTVRRLESGKLENYFDTKINILEGKDMWVLNELANFLEKEWDKLIHI